VDSLYARDQAVGGAALLRQALMHWQYARRMLGESSYTEPIERQLLASVRTLNELRPLRAVDGPHTEERAAFCEQFDAVARSMAS
jgi:hypothetical protein